MEDFNFRSASTKFIKQNVQSWTFEYPIGQEAQLDYILDRKKFDKSNIFFVLFHGWIRNRIASANVKLSMRFPEKHWQMLWKLSIVKLGLSWQESIYAICNSVYYRFQELFANTHLDSNNILSIYDNFMKANEGVALSSPPQKPKSRKNTISSDDNITVTRENIRNISFIYQTKPSQTCKLIAAKNPSIRHISLQKLFFSMGK